MVGSVKGPMGPIRFVDIVGRCVRTYRCCFVAWVRLSRFGLRLIDQKKLDGVLWKNCIDGDRVVIDQGSIEN